MGGPPEVSIRSRAGGKAGIPKNDANRARLQVCSPAGYMSYLDLSGQYATDHQDESRLGLVLARSSHSVRLIDHLESANLRGTHRLHGFQASESHKVAEMATDLAKKVSDMDQSSSLVLIQLLRV